MPGAGGPSCLLYARNFGFVWERAWEDSTAMALRRDCVLQPARWSINAAPCPEPVKSLRLNREAETLLDFLLFYRRFPQLSPICSNLTAWYQSVGYSRLLFTR